MTEYVSISIPESLAKRATELARARRQSLDVVIADVLEQSLPAAALANSTASSPTFAFTPESEQRMRQETTAYVAMHDYLMATYAGQYVAIFEKQLVDHDEDEAALLRRIDARYPDSIVLIKRVAPLPEPDLRIRSPWPERSQQ